MTPKRKNTVGRHTRRVRRQEFTAKTILRLASGVIIAILLVIIGYILYKGFVTDKDVKDRVLSAGSADLAFPDGEDLTVIINDGLRTDSIMMNDLILLYNGRARNWGGITQQDIHIATFTYREDNPLRSRFHHAVLNDGAYRETTEVVDSESDMIRRVAETPGGIGYVSAQTARTIEHKGVKAVKIRRLALLPNPQVLEAQEGQRLNEITEEQVRAIFAGEVDNWREVGGIDLPVTVVSLPDSPQYRQFSELMMQGRPVAANLAAQNEDELVSLLSANPGAVAVCYYDEANYYIAPALGTKVDHLAIEVEYHETGSNLSLPYILEAPKEGGSVGGISTIILNTVFMIILTLVFAVPIGVLAAVFLTEYANQGWLMRILQFGTDTLAGIPSIIFGLFGYIFFCGYMGLGVGLISGTLTITLMILPTIVKTTSEALKTVPMSYREGSFAVGATKWQTIAKVVLPAAMPGVLTGVILGIGRAVGETAALVFTMGNKYDLARSLTSSARVLSVHLYRLITQQGLFDRAFATATILIAIVLLVNFTANKLIGRMSKMTG
jgi:phosphate transport system permease protein